MDLQLSFRIALLRTQDLPIAPWTPCTQHPSLHQFGAGWMQSSLDRLSLSSACDATAKDLTSLQPSPEQLLLIPLQAPCQEVAVPVAAPLVPTVIFGASVPYKTTQHHQTGETVWRKLSPLLWAWRSSIWESVHPNTSVPKDIPGSNPERPGKALCLIKVFSLKQYCPRSTQVHVF